MMALAGPILSALLPIVFVVALGWGAGATGAVPKDGSKVLAAFVVKFALPIALFLAAAKARPEDILNPPYVAALLAGLVGTYALGFVAARVQVGNEPDKDAMRALTCSFPNMAYCGPPVLLAAVGPGALLSVVIGNLVTSLVLVPLTLVLLERHHHATGKKQADEVHGFGKPLLEAVTKPLVYLPLAGVVVALLRIPIPEMIVGAADEIGRAAGGAALFTLGLILSGIKLNLSPRIALNVGIKGVVQPMLILLVGLLVGLRGDPLKAVFLIGVLPSATENAMLALANDTCREETAATVAASTIFALATITAGIIVSERFL